MLFSPLAHVDAIDRAEANRLLVAWGHKMGAYTRSNYTIKAHHALFQLGEPVDDLACGPVVIETGRDLIAAIEGAM